MPTRPGVLGLVGWCLVVSLPAASSQLHAQPVSGSLVGRPVPTSDNPRAELLRVVVARFGPDGRLYVAERMHQDIRVFDQAGRFVGNVGRAGAGPGEFRQIDNLGWVGDTLWTSDAALQRFTLFDNGSRPIATVPKRAREAAGRAVLDFLTPYGRIVQPDPRVERTGPAPIVRMTRDKKSVCRTTCLPVFCLDTFPMTPRHPYCRRCQNILCKSKLRVESDCERCLYNRRFYFGCRCFQIRV
jgi:hypothetical protein